jgi:photosystem II stability/assembly factor-like uncharacterized protein
MQAALRLVLPLCAVLPALAQDPPPPPQQADESAPQQPTAPEPETGAEAPRRGGASRPSLPRAKFDTDTDMVRDLAWRNLGPANPMGRMTDLAVPAQDRRTWFVGTAGGGVFRTQNAGTTWTNVSSTFGSVSIGDVAVAPSDAKIVWVGTGEENARNSVQWGDGVYKSTDGGDTWTHMGLRETFQIGHVEVHPTNPDIVFVAALGRLWGENEERGVYRTKDGGLTWEKTLFVDARTGAMDVRVDPKNPDTVYACTYERSRDRFDGNDPAVRFGAGSGLWKSIDGGTTWARMQGGAATGLPSCMWGRSGIDVAPDGAVLLIVETERSGWAKGDRKDRTQNDEIPEDERQQQEQRQRQNRQPRQTAILGVGSEGENGAEGTPGAILTQVTDDGPAAKAGLRAGDRVTKVDDEDVKTYADLIEIVRDSRGGQKATFTYVRGEATETVEITYGTRSMDNVLGGGNGPYSGRLFGQAANKQKYQGENGYETGGVFSSGDGGASWTRRNSLTERPFYYSVIRVDPSDSAFLYAVGTTLWQSKDGGAKFEGINKDIHVDFHAIWIDPQDGAHLIAACDGGVNESFDRGASWQVHQGFCAAQYYDITADNSVPYNVLGGLQDNGTWVGPSRTRWREGIGFSDWVTIYGGDGFGAQTDPVEPWIVYATSQNGALGMVDLRNGEQMRIARQTPRQGTAKFNWDSPFVLSPHNRLTLWSAGNFVYRSERYAHLDSRAANAEWGPVKNGNGMTAAVVSPALGLTDDGTATALCESPRVRDLLYVGTDDGALWRGEVGGEWTEIQQNLPAVPGARYVSDLHASFHKDGRVYLTLDGHRSDDMRTYVFVSEDKGVTWTSLASGLPAFEPCYAIAEDPRNENLLFLGTEYGCHVSLDRGDHWFPLGKDLPTCAVRDLFVHDRDADLVAATHGRGVFVVDIAPLRAFDAAASRSAMHLFPPEDAVLWRMRSRGTSGNRGFFAKNPAYGAPLHVHCKGAPEEKPVVTIHDVTGKQVARIEGEARAGLQSLHWDARADGKLAKPGAYSARMTVGKDTQIRAFRLLPDPESAATDDDTTRPTPGRAQEELR